MTIDTTISKEQALQQIGEHLVKETAAKMVADIGPMLASGTSGSVVGDAKNIFCRGNGSMGQAGGIGIVSPGGER